MTDFDPESLPALDYDRAHELAGQVLAEHGRDKVYVGPTGDRAGGCFYVHDGPAGPVCGCLVGAILEKHGVPLSAIDNSVNGELVFALIANLGLDVTGEAKGFLSDMQRRQDKGEPWGTAVDYAEEEHALHCPPEHSQDGGDYPTAGCPCGDPEH